VIDSDHLTFEETIMVNLVHLQKGQEVVSDPPKINFLGDDNTVHGIFTCTGE